MKHNKISLIIVAVVVLSLIFSMSGISFAQSIANKEVRIVDELSTDEINDVKLKEYKSSIVSNTEHQELEINKADVSKINISTCNEISGDTYELTVTLPIDKNRRQM